MLDAVDATGHRRADAQAPAAGDDQIAGQACAEAHGKAADNGEDLGQSETDAQGNDAEVRATIIAQLVSEGRKNGFAIRQRMRVRQAAEPRRARLLRLHNASHGSRAQEGDGQRLRAPQGDPQR